MSKHLKLFCDFGCGTTCTITVDLVCADPKNLYPKTEWVGSRTQEMFPKYLEWIHTVNHSISETYKRDHANVIRVFFEPSHWQFWVYHPNGDKKLVAEADGKFEPSLINR